MLSNKEFEKNLELYESITRSRKRGMFLFFFIALVCVIVATVMLILRNIYGLMALFFGLVFLGFGLFRYINYFHFDKKYTLYKEIFEDMKTKNIRKEFQKRDLNLNILEYEISPYIYLSIKMIDNDLCYKEFKIYKNKTYISFGVSKKMLETDTVTFRKYLKNKYGKQKYLFKNNITREEFYNLIVENNKENEEYNNLRTNRQTKNCEILFIFCVILFKK